MAHELIFGLVAPVGTDVDAVAADLVRQLQVLCHYSVNTVRVSELIDRFANLADPPQSEFEDHRIARLVNAGDKLCAAHDNPAAVAQLVVAEIRRIRKTLANDPAPNGARQAFVIKTLKRPAEVQLMRRTYGPQFVLVAAQDTIDARMQRLTSKHLSSVDEEDRKRIATELVSIDADEQNEKHGQRVNKTFAEADYFLAPALDSERLLKLLWGDPTIAPEANEYAMYAAHAAAARSLSASRRVGAALVVNDRLIATGFNDVPPGEKADIVEGRDASEKYKRQMLQETLELLQPHLGFDKRLIRRETLDDLAKALEGSMVLSVIEGQRAVHAEAAAIDDAARRGVAVEGATLYTTTFPCHLCFKAALGAGISEVVYIYPYPKSRARDMFPASTRRLQPYRGVAPRMFIRAFLERKIPVADLEGNLPQTTLAIDSPFLPAGQAIDVTMIDRCEVAATAEFAEKR